MDYSELLQLLRSGKPWMKVLAVIIVALVAIITLFSCSCSRRTFTIHASGERVEFSYKDSLQNKK